MSAEKHMQHMLTKDGMTGFTNQPPSFPQHTMVALQPGWLPLQALQQSMPLHHLLRQTLEHMATVLLQLLTQPTPPMA
jgi:hypothetical protein